MTTAYPPAGFIDWLIARLGFKNDARLCDALGVNRPLISRIRHQHVPVSPALILRIHEKFSIPVAEIRAALAGEAPA